MVPANAGACVLLNGFLAEKKNGFFLLSRLTVQLIRLLFTLSGKEHERKASQVSG